jgi:type IV pilus assembly protein PilV
VKRASGRRQRGVTLVEVLVALIITAFGLLGLLGIQMRAYAAEVESYQRAQAAILLQDMVSRLRTNRNAAPDYVAADIGVGAFEECAGRAGAELDLCEWGNLLRGAAERVGANTVGAMLNARGCIDSPEDDTFVIAVVWEGATGTAGPANPCGAGEYADESLRRAVTAVVRLATLVGA